MWVNFQPAAGDKENSVPAGQLTTSFGIGGKTDSGQVGAAFQPRTALRDAERPAPSLPLPPVILRPWGDSFSEIPSSGSTAERSG